MHAYKDAKCILICFSLDDKGSLDRACDYWMKECKALGPVNAKKILVGLKSDIRDAELTRALGQKKCQYYKLEGYIECSAKYNIGVS